MTWIPHWINWPTSSQVMKPLRSSPTVVMAILLSIGCKTGSQLAVAKDVTSTDQAEIIAIFERSCGTCHSSWYRDPGQSSSVTWALIAADSQRISKVTNRSGSGVQMPPATAPQSAQLSVAEAALVHDKLAEIAANQPIFNPSNLPLDRLTLPAGFQISVFATVVGARGMAKAPDGTIFIGTGGFSDVDPNQRVTAIRDVNGDKTIDPGTEQWVIDRDLDNPNGVAFLDGDLYVAERFRLLRYPDILSHLGNPPTPLVISTDFPHEDNHSWKYLAAGPDGNLYIPVGAPCNICDPERGSTAGKFNRIFRLKLNATKTRIDAKEVVASGIRNTVGYAWHPSTRELWFTDNGRDEIDRDLNRSQRNQIVADMGIVVPPGEILNNLIPPDELNHVTQSGQDFGFPHCHGKLISDPSFAGSIDCKTTSAFEKPAMELQGHAAALGMKFYDGGVFPVDYENRIFISEHGSWNSTPGFPKGYKVSMVTLDASGQTALSYEPFIAGFAYQDRGQTVDWGRPVDILVANDGALMVSDDRAGVIYRVTYTAP